MCVWKVFRLLVFSPLGRREYSMCLLTVKVKGHTYYGLSMYSNNNNPHTHTVWTRKGQPIHLFIDCALAPIIDIYMDMMVWICFFHDLPLISNLTILQSITARNSKNYPQARKHGRNALILIVLNIIFTLSLVMLFIGLSVGFNCANPESGSRYYSGN